MIITIRRRLTRHTRLRLRMYNKTWTKAHAHILTKTASKAVGDNKNTTIMRSTARTNNVFRSNTHAQGETKTTDMPTTKNKITYTQLQ